MKKIFTTLALGAVLLTMAQPAVAQETNLLANKGIYTLGEPKTWNNGTTDYTFQTDDLSKLVAVPENSTDGLPTNTDNVFLFPEGGYDKEANIEIGIQGFYVDMGSSQKVGSVSFTWEGATAKKYNIYVMDEEPTLTNLPATPDAVGEIGQVKSNTTILSDGAQGQYLVFEPTEALNYGWGVKIRTIAAKAPEADKLSTFTISPNVVAGTTQTPITLTLLNQHGLAIPEDDVQIEITSGEAVYENGNITVLSGDVIEFTATLGDDSLTYSIYAASAPAVPAASQIALPIFTNTTTTYNADVEFTVAWNGGAINDGTVTYANGAIAQLFDNTYCVFFSNKQTTGAWDSANLIESYADYENLCLDIFPGATTSNGYIQFEGAQGGNEKNAIELTAGEWNHITIPVTDYTNIKNYSLRFPIDGESVDLLLTNVYFSPVVDEDAEVPVLGEITYTSTQTTVTLNLSVTEGDDVTYTVTDGTNTETTSENTVTFEGLIPSYTYQYTVTASNANGTSQPVVVSASTQEITLPDAPSVEEANTISIFSTAFGQTQIPNFAPDSKSTAQMAVRYSGTQTRAAEGSQPVLFFYNFSEGNGGSLTGLNLDVTGAQYLYVSVFAPVEGTITLNGTWNAAGGTVKGENGYTIEITSDKAGQWTNDSIEVAALGYVNEATLSELSIASTVPNFFVDNLTFEGDEPLAVESVEAENGIVNVYNLQGICVKKGVKTAEAIENLPAGLYIVNGKKVLVK